MSHPMPRPLSRPSAAPATLSGLLMDLAAHTPEKAAREYPWADRFVMGLPLAPWQREFKWTPEQCERFITSAWTGVFLGTYVITETQYRKEEPAVNGYKGFQGIEYEPLTNMVIEGQQRLKALELYVSDQLAVPDANGKLALWSEVDTVDQRRFKNTIFTRGELRERDESELRRFYDLLNFGGTPHENHERASVQSPRP